ncbi:VWA domain-containing protein [Spirosoma koreense]
MQTSFLLFLGLAPLFASGYYFRETVRETPQQALNQYVAFLNHSVDDVTRRFHQLQTYQADRRSYPARPGSALTLSSSGPLETYYYQKALAAEALTDAERARLKTGAQALWNILTRIDQTFKALETYNRLKDYEQDHFRKADGWILELQALFDQFNQDSQPFYKQLQRIYHRYQPYSPSDAHLFTENEMVQALTDQQTVLDTLRQYLDETGAVNWPVELIQRSIRSDEKTLATFGKAKPHIGYPADAMLDSFRNALRSIQELKKQAIDDYTFSARKSARHNNAFYESFLNHYNNDLISWYQQFVQYSLSSIQLLDHPKYSPVFSIAPPVLPTGPTSATPHFADSSPTSFTLKRATAPASPATFQALNGYVDFINESLRQMNTLQGLLRQYQSSVASFRNAVRNGRRGSLTYVHDEYKVPLSEHQLLILHSQAIPQPYRASISGQADVLLAILKEMDALSIELIAYTSEKHYEQDDLQRSDAILTRYAYLFDTFDRKKERLYEDVRRIQESYPVSQPTDSWVVAGKALLSMIDLDKEVLFGVKAYLKQETTTLPATEPLKTAARKLIIDEYENLKGLKRLGRSNGLCPYSPYEDLADHSINLAEMVPKVPARSSREPYESFYYSFKELVYQYNKFSELAREQVLKTIDEPNVFTFRRSSPLPSQSSKAEKASSTITHEPTATLAVEPSALTKPFTTTAPAHKTAIQHDTVFIDRTKVDTVYVTKSSDQSEGALSLTGFPANNLVLLLDVSASMDSPAKLPLLKKSINSLLTLLRPEDQISVVIYSGKARVALKPTSGMQTAEIARIIGQLQPAGDTDGNRGIQLAYKLADKAYIRAGNNRIILATDGEFPISDDVYRLVQQASEQAIYLTIFTFSRKEMNSEKLKRLAQLGKGTYAHITAENADRQLILEAQAKKMP